MNLTWIRRSAGIRPTSDLLLTGFWWDHFHKGSSHLHLLILICHILIFKFWQINSQFNSFTYLFDFMRFISNLICQHRMQFFVSVSKIRFIFFSSLTWFDLVFSLKKRNSSYEVNWRVLTVVSSFMDGEASSIYLDLPTRSRFINIHWSSILVNIQLYEMNEVP